MFPSSRENISETNSNIMLIDSTNSSGMFSVRLIFNFSFIIYYNIDLVIYFALMYQFGLTRTNFPLALFWRAENNIRKCYILCVSSRVEGGRVPGWEIPIIERRRQQRLVFWPWHWSSDVIEPVREEEGSARWPRSAPVPEESPSGGRGRGEPVSHSRENNGSLFHISLPSGSRFYSNAFLPTKRCMVNHK